MNGLWSSGKTLLEAGGASSATVVGHRYGPEAQGLTKQVGGSVKRTLLISSGKSINTHALTPTDVALVYIE